MNEDDKHRLQEHFGRAFSDADLAFYGSRLVRQLNALERLRAWESELGMIEPTPVFRVAVSGDE
jgi:hypothetical protein